MSELTDSFRELYYNSRVFMHTYWLGVIVGKNPLDLWLYEEIIAEVRPDVIVECGTAFGGSALFFASICELIGNGRVISIDILSSETRPSHNRIEYLTGSSVSPEILAKVAESIGAEETVMVSLDSIHERDHVLQELRHYSRFVTPGSYLVAEDTMIGHPTLPELLPGPMEAVEAFLHENEDFEADSQREKFFMSFNPGGWLRRKGSHVADV
jgi:cephalosporin hydroxylase